MASWLVADGAAPTAGVQLGTCLAVRTLTAGRNAGEAGTLQEGGEGEAEALDIYASSFSKSPDFYEFLRTLETYEKVIDKKTTLVLPGDSKLFKNLTE